MNTLLIFFCCIGFYAFYLTSDRIAIDRSTWVSSWVFSNKTTGKAIGFLLLLVSMRLAIEVYGLAAGLCVFFILLMTMASLIIVLKPLKIVGYKSIALLLLLSFLSELLIA